MAIYWPDTAEPEQLVWIFGAIFVLCLCALGMIRLMGSRTVGQLAPLDFVIMVGLGDIIVTTAMDCQQNFWGGIAGLAALLLLQRLLSYFSLKSKLCRRLFEGVPAVLIQDGRIIRENFRQTRFNYDDLRQELHKLGLDMDDLPDIKLARLESCGVFTVIKCASAEPVTRGDVSRLLAAGGAPEWQRLSRLIERLEKYLASRGA